jgi:hypothetical protein
MATQIPLVIIGGRIRRLPSGDDIATGASTFSRTFTSTANAGQAVYSDSATSVDLTNASSDASSEVDGLAIAGVSAAASGSVQYAGILDLSTALWDAVVLGASGGLVFGTRYYLSDLTAGMLLPSSNLSSLTQGEFVVEVGRAISTTELLIDIQPRVQL